MCGVVKRFVPAKRPASAYFVRRMSSRQRHVPPVWSQQIHDTSFCCFMKCDVHISLLSPSASVGGSAVPARDGNILIVGGNNFRYAEGLSQPGFTGIRVGGFHDTSFQSDMKCDVYPCKELYIRKHLFVGCRVVSDGSCSCFSHDFCCTGLPEED